MNRILKISMIILVVLFNSAVTNAAEKNNIAIYCSEQIATINKKVFGNNIIAYDPLSYGDMAREYYGYSDYGAGIWNPIRNYSIQEVINLSKDAGVTILRFPGGCGSHKYNWKSAVGNQRVHFLYGVDEFLKTCSEIGAEAVFTVSYYIGSENDAADLVEYLNSPNNGNNPNGGTDWAAERAKNGHPLPYNVEYFEIGNEEWHGDHLDIKSVSPETYAVRYLKYYNAMKSVDTNIKIGAILFYQEPWNPKVIAIIKNKIDFGIIHTYANPGVTADQLIIMNPKDIFYISLTKFIPNEENSIQYWLKLLKDGSGKDIPLAITEYNGGFRQEKPVPYRHCLGTALINAEFLRIFSKPKHNILMANYWEFNNNYWGMISNGFGGTNATLNNPYFKRPNYYVFELYAKHFGEILISTDTATTTGASSGVNLLSGNWQITNFTGANVEQNFGVLSMDFVNPTKFNYYHSKQIAQIEPDTSYLVSGYIKTTNLIDYNGFCLEIGDARGWTATQSAVSTAKITGTVDWKYVEAVYRTLPDATAINVIARRIGGAGPLTGRVWFKDVRLEKYSSIGITETSNLSVNVSKNIDGSKVYLMVVNKNMDNSEIATIELKDFIPVSSAKSWVLNGPSIDATNEVNHDNVKVTYKVFQIYSNPFQFTFEPHSLTAIEIEKAVTGGGGTTGGTGGTTGTGAGTGTTGSGTGTTPGTDTGTGSSGSTGTGTGTGTGAGTGGTGAGSSGGSGGGVSGGTSGGTASGGTFSGGSSSGTVSGGTGQGTTGQIASKEIGKKRSKRLKKKTVRVGQVTDEKNAQVIAQEEKPVVKAEEQIPVKQKTWWQRFLEWWRGIIATLKI